MCSADTTLEGRKYVLTAKDIKESLGLLPDDDVYPDALLSKSQSVLTCENGI
jgi:hypothetical protein